MPDIPYYLSDIGEGSVVLVPGDLHMGACDLITYYLMLHAAEDAGITHVVLQGDTFECGGLSTHPKGAKSQNDGTLKLEREIAEARVPLADLYNLVGNINNCVAIPGNHEERVNRHVDEFPALEGTVTWDKVYAEAFGGTWCTLPSGYFVQAGPLSIFHGHKLKGSLSRYPAEKVLSEYSGQSTMFGHSHRINSSTRPTWKRGRQTVHGAWNIGHMANMKHPSMAYVNDPSWEQGAAIVSYFADREGDLYFNVDMMRVMRDGKDRPTLLFRGKAYR